MKKPEKREIEAEFKSLLESYPVVVVTGPRQAGKTTLVRSVCKELPYFSLEEPDIRDSALSDPRRFLNKSSSGIVLDEIQRAPELLSYIQGMVDAEKKPGRFILTGSQQFEMTKSITQSLAGRAAMLRLLPFTIAETKVFKKNMSADDYLVYGFYPAIYDQKLEPFRTYRNYFETYIQRDLRDLAYIKDLRLFQKFVRLCAGRTGQIFNSNSLANEVGVSHNTIQSWLSTLEASYIVFLLEPYYENVGKRLIKSPKLYFYDVGLASYLLGIQNRKHLESHPLRGSLFENMVVVELLKSRTNRGLDSGLFFYRDSHQQEVDIIFSSGNKLTPVEIKGTETFNKDNLKGLKAFKKVFPKKATRGYVVYEGKIALPAEGTDVLPYTSAAKIVDG